MEKRMITTDVIEEDKRLEGSLRPQTLDEYIGQEKIKIKIRFDIRFIIILSSFIAFILIRIEHPGLCLLLSG